MRISSFGRTAPTLLPDCRELRCSTLIENGSVPEDMIEAQSPWFPVEIAQLVALFLTPIRILALSKSSPCWLL